MNIKELVDNFSIMDDWEDRYAYLISLGDGLPPMAEALKTDTTKVQGCMSQVWMVLGWDDQGKLTFLADSDAQIVKGLIAILHIICANKTIDEISGINVEEIFGQLGLDTHLSPNRRNGFFSMVERVNSFTSQHT